MYKNLFMFLQRSGADPGSLVTGFVGGPGAKPPENFSGHALFLLGHALFPKGNTLFNMETPCLNIFIQIE